MSVLAVKGLKVAVDGKEILHGVDLTINSGETHIIMGPNGSGKSTLVYTIAGHPKYEITSGSIMVDGVDINDHTPDERAKLGIFLASQLPTAIEGITLSNFMRASVGAITGETPKVREWIKTLSTAMQELGIPEDFANRSVNVGFSGGERKRSEILQLKLLHPKFALLDETDSGLDVDAIKSVSQGIVKAHQDDNFGSLIITHHKNMLEYIKPDYVHVFKDGKIIQTGDANLANELIKTGYQNL